MTRFARLLFAGLLVLDAGAGAQPDQEAGAEADVGAGFKVVVNAANPLRELPAKDVQRIFYKNTTRWEGWQEDGREVPVTPVDRERGAEVRKLFSQAIFKKSASAIESYWQRQIFSGDDIPPEKLATEADVLDFVRRDRGAIGYVSRDAVLAGGVKELRIIE
jgi:ABC-type phosphate transport system substrate-binding protein